jgi:hypothetical protein
MYLTKNRVNELENGVTKAKKSLKLIDAPVYKYWETLYLSFYSRQLYVDVGKRWRGFGLLYLLFVIAVLSIPFATKVSFNLNKSYNEQIIEPLLLLPTVYVQNGDASFDKPMPYLIKNKKNQVVAIIDTTGKVDSFNAQYPYLNILITKNIFYYKLPTPQFFSAPAPDLNAGVPLSQTFGKGSNFVFDGKKIIEENSVTRFKYASELLTYPMVIAILYSMFVILFLVLAFLGQLFSNVFFGFTVSFKQSSRLFLVATTPMLFLLIFTLTIDYIFPGLGFILLALIVFYFSFAIFSLRAESRRLVSQ